MHVQDVTLDNRAVTYHWCQHALITMMASGGRTVQVADRRDDLLRKCRKPGRSWISANWYLSVQTKLDNIRSLCMNLHGKPGTSSKTDLA